MLKHAAPAETAGLTPIIIINAIIIFIYLNMFLRNCIGLRMFCAWSAPYD